MKDIAEKLYIGIRDEIYPSGLDAEKELEVKKIFLTGCLVTLHTIRLSLIKHPVDVGVQFLGDFEKSIEDAFNEEV